MQWTDLLSYMRSGNDKQCRFITRVSSELDLLPILVALANSDGGRVFIGIDIKNYHLIGCDITSNWVMNAINTTCFPPISVTFERVRRDNKHVLAIEVDKGIHKPYRHYDQCYFMDESGVRLATKSEMTLMADGATPYDPASTPVKMQDLDEIITSDVIKSTTVESEGFETVTNEAGLSKCDDSDAVSDIAPVAAADTSSQALDEIVSDLDDAPESRDVVDETSFSAPTEAVNDGTSFRPTLIKSDENSAEAVPEGIQPLAAVSAQTVPSLTDRQKQAISFLKYGDAETDRLKNKKYRELYGVSHKTAHLELTDLVNRGILEQEGAGRSTCYKLTLAHA